jgi:dTDP-4-dehydrorhamnose reductase
LLVRGKEGIVHVTATGDCTWYEFARAIAARVKPGAEIHPILSAQCGRPARRPAYAVLDTARYREWTGHAMPGWEKGLEEYLGNVQ